MRSLFRSFDREGVQYLLISGQASVLYGAATFSEDIDIWVRASAPNLRRMLRSLAAARARVHKLTPPVTMRYASRGHGFHFIIPGRPLPTYLDVMARPPRVRTFEAAWNRARSMPTDWGILPVVAIEDLIALKKTRRLSDYEVISNLVQTRLSESAIARPALLRWAARNSFRAEDRTAVLARLGETVDMEACRRAIAGEVATLQARDVAYWAARIAELRTLRRSHRLWPEGETVATLLGNRHARSVK
jgi:hypothetical protein